ncbi:tetratricopeptide repeat protein [Bacteroides fragilis]|nr:tetratricopeptide repeat protein [Bacteroides fragilis]
MNYEKKISRLICAVACCVPVALQAQTSEKITSPVNLYKEGKELFLQKNYAAAMPPLRTFVRQKADVNLKEEAEYMLVCSAYELKDRNAIAQLRSYLDTYPDTPHANRIYALIASAYFYQGNYDEALALFNSSRLDLLGNEERDDMTYRLATCYLKVGNVKEAAIWFETLKASSPKYANDCSYYISYIRYTQKRYDEALKGFLPLQDDAKYKALVPYYIAEIYAIKKNYDKAQIVAQNYLSAYPQNEHAAEMYRILGDAYYHFGDYHKAVTSFRNYLEKENAPRRDALYMLGLSYFQTGVFSKAAETLGEVTTENDALTQNAYLHMGLAYLHLAEKNKARMAFEQVAASNANPKIKEQAAYNYALCIHETSYSAFGESVTVFEKFLNEFPTSEYAEMVSSYLVEVYMNTRSYEAALKSIDRIAHPGKRILEAKQRILFQLGTQAFANTQFEQSIGYFDRSLGLGQYNRQTKADALYWRGEAYYRLNRMEEAKRNFTDYLQLTQQTNNEMYALAHYNLGYIAFHQKDYVQAQNWFRKYISLEKGENKTALADAYNRIGDCYLDVRNFDEAKHYYSQAEAMNTPSGDYSFYQLALVSGLQKDYSGKITWLNRLAGKYPASPYAISALYEKGRSYVLMDNNQQAITSFKELLAKYPESPVSRKAAAEIGLLYYQNEDYNQAIDAYKQVVQKYPGSDEARLAMRDLKSIYVDMNRIDEFAALASAMPGNIRFDASEQDSLTYMAAEKIYMRGRVEQAKESFGKYLQTFPDGAFGLNAHYYLCLIGKEQKNYDMILEHSGKLLEYPDNPFSEEALIMRAEVQFNKVQFADALASYKMLKEKATTAERRLLAETGMLRAAYLLKDDTETIHAATALLSEAKLSPELKNEALYYRAKAYLNQKGDKATMADLKELAKDTRNLYGAEAKFLVAQELYNTQNYAAAEKELLNFIDQSTPHAYWLARGFILLSDVYVAMDKKLDARQYLLSLQQNYHADDDIENMIESRLNNLNK